jgi:hypothetical protein
LLKVAAASLGEWKVEEFLSVRAHVILEQIIGYRMPPFMAHWVRSAGTVPHAYSMARPSSVSRTPGTRARKRSRQGRPSGLAQAFAVGERTQGPSSGSKPDRRGGLRTASGNRPRRSAPSNLSGNIARFRLGEFCCARYIRGIERLLFERRVNVNVQLL